jgi:hypothetical protein
MAAYLGQVNLVKSLLEEGQGRILVDGVDEHQATPLMCMSPKNVVMSLYLTLVIVDAARDGHVDIVQCLVSQRFVKMQSVELNTLS